MYEWKEGDNKYTFYSVKFEAHMVYSSKVAQQIRGSQAFRFHTPAKFSNKYEEPV